MSHARRSGIAAVAALCSLLAAACGPAATTDPPTTREPSQHVPDIQGPTASTLPNGLLANAPEGPAQTTPLDGNPEHPRPTGVVHTVQVTDTSYTPTTLTLSLGDSVDFVFTAGYHSVTSGFECLADGMFESGRRESGSTYRVTFLRTGVFPFFSEDDCERMTGALLVKN